MLTKFVSRYRKKVATCREKSMSSGHRPSLPAEQVERGEKGGERGELPRCEKPMLKF